MRALPHQLGATVVTADTPEVRICRCGRSVQIVERINYCKCGAPHVGKLEVVR